jgi:hypothetical protein
MKRSRAILVLGLALLLLVSASIFLFRSPDEPVYQGRPISAWIEQMSGPIGGSAGAVSSEALPKLIQQDPGVEVVPSLCHVLHRGRSLGHRIYAALCPQLPSVVVDKLPMLNPGRDAELRYRAALILYYLGPKATNAVSALTYALQDNNPEVRRMAATALGAVQVESASPALGAALSDPVAGVRQAAIKALAQTSELTNGVLQIAGTLKDPDVGVRVEAARALKNFGPKAKDVIPALIEALHDADQDVVLFAAQALGRIGPDARKAAPELQAVLKKAGPECETTLRWALKQVTRVGDSQ